MPRTRTSKLSLITPRPAASPGMPFVAPAPLARSPLEGAARALAAFAPSLAKYQDAKDAEEERETAAKASAEFSPVVSTLIGKSPEEAEKAYAEAVSKGLLQQQSPEAKKARGDMWGAADAQWVFNQFSREAAQEQFNSHTDPLTNEMVEGTDPTERLNELKAQALKSYGSTRLGADWSQAFTSAMASYQRDIDYQILRIQAADDSKETVKSAAQNFSELIPRLGGLVIPKEEDQDRAKINKIQLAVQKEYEQVRASEFDAGREGTWAREVSKELLKALNVFRMTSGSDEETYDVYEELLATPIGHKTLGDIDEFRLMAAKFELDLISGERTEQDRNDRVLDRENRRAGETVKNDIAAEDARLRREGVASADERRGLLEVFFDARLQETPGETQGAAAREGRAYLNGLAQDLTEFPGEADRHARTIDAATTEEELASAQRELDSARDLGRVPRSYDDLRKRIDNKRDPVRILQSSKSYKDASALNEAIQKDDFPFLADEQGKELRAMAMDATLEVQRDMETLVENGQVNEGAVREKLLEFRETTVKGLRDTARENKDKVTQIEMDLVGAGAEEADVVRELSGLASTRYIKDVAGRALAMRNHHDALIYDKGFSPAYALAEQQVTTRLTAESADPIDINAELGVWRAKLEDGREALRGKDLSLATLRASDDAIGDEMLAATKLAPAAPTVEGEEAGPTPTPALSGRRRSRVNALGAGSGVLADKDNALNYTSLEDYTVQWGKNVGAGGIPDELVEALDSAIYAGPDPWWYEKPKSMDSARARSENLLLLLGLQDDWSEKQIGAATAVTFGPMGVRLDEWVQGKKTLNPSPPPIVGATTLEAYALSIFGAFPEAREVKFPTTALLSSTTPIIELVEVTREAMATNSSVEKAQEAWMRANEQDLDTLAKKYGMTESDYDIFIVHQKQLSKKQAPY